QLAVGLLGFALGTVRVEHHNDFAQFNDVGLLAWVISGYMVAMTVAVPIYGKLGDLYGRRRMILTGISLVTLASI
ncbi:hypothetical protein PpSQ1_27180, partial [Pseudomonas putida]